ncbi:hypothetical protein KCP69_22605 [Salmonella enterica subsp. enterica]|nr:hypothetical protein KCP69_22605 [Salmonella enterica subsp. enterica]
MARSIKYGAVAHGRGRLRGAVVEASHQAQRRHFRYGFAGTRLSSRRTRASGGEIGRFRFCGDAVIY